MSGHTVLVVDDDFKIRKNTAKILENAGYKTTIAEDGKSALGLLHEKSFDVVLLDLVMPEIDGLELLEKFNGIGHDSVVIMITGHGKIETAVEAMKKGAYHYVTKPIDFDNLKFLIREGLEKKTLLYENIMLKETLKDNASFSGIIGKSKGMKEVVEIIRLAAKKDSNVLVLGETGTGKEIIADAIHFNSARNKHPFRKVNCAALTDTILESELFGHEKGAFTDAKGMQKGFFELAHKGTLLLDEIGCMTQKTQSNFLRVLEDKKVKRIGGENEFEVDVRIIASTNEMLEKAVEENRFRKDLYYRLNVIKIVIPPLRKRKDDIPLLVKHFVNKFKKDVRVSEEVMERLLEHNWPGNVRELENIIERAFIYQIDDEIKVEHLPKDFTASMKPDIIGIPSDDVTLKDFTRIVVLKTLEKANGNQSEAARILGVSRYFVANQMKGEKK